MDFEPMHLGSNHGNRIFFYVFFFFFFVICYSANSTLLSLLRFSKFIIPCDAQASSAFSALILFAFFIFFKYSDLQTPVKKF